MKAKTLISMTAAMVLASAAYASEDMHTKMKIAWVDGSDDGDVHIELDSAELGFDLHDMQVGENQSFVDGSGRNVLVTREEDGFTLNVDGKVIELPIMSGVHDGEHEKVWIQKFDGDADVDVHVVHDEDHGDRKVKVIRKKIEIKSDSPSE